MYREVEPDVPGDHLFDKNHNKLWCKYIKVNSALDGIDGYDQNGNKLNGTYKKQEHVIAYNKNRPKLDGLYLRDEAEGINLQIYYK